MFRVAVVNLALRFRKVDQYWGIVASREGEGRAKRLFRQQIGRVRRDGRPHEWVALPALQECLGIGESLGGSFIVRSGKG